MAICPSGHTTTSVDYCDTCGLPIGDGSPVAQAPVQPDAPAPAECPHCGAPHAPDALFCEACGYDFTTGTPPRSATSAEPAEAAPQDEHEAPPAPAAPQPDPEPERVAEPAEAGAGWAPDAPDAGHVPPSALNLPADPAVQAEAPDSPLPAQLFPSPTPQAAAVPPQPAAQPAAKPHPRLLQPQPTSIDWVAEVWIDPDWYATQGSTDALPSPGLPEVVPLRATSVLIGRASASRNIHPDIDCDPDTGVSRRHAQVSTDGTRWWIEDLESANGTFVGPSAGRLPTEPIGRGRVEFSPDQRIYLGGWTRIVIRRATEDEQQAFGPAK